MTGQASNTTWEFSTSAFAQRVHSHLGDRIGNYPEWIAKLSDSSELGHPEVG